MDIGNKLYRIALCQEWVYTVIGIHAYIDRTVYHIKSDKTNSDNGLEMLVTLSSMGDCYKFAGHLGEDINGDRYLHDDDASFFPSKEGALIAYYDTLIKEKEKDIAERESLLKTKHKDLARLEFLRKQTIEKS